MERAIELLKKMFGDEASFREGQLEAIHNAVDGKRQLIVRKTGWGKSLIYFISSKIICEQERGLTLVISPLISLMRNQILNAKKAGIVAYTLNSAMLLEEIESIEREIVNNRCDMLLVSPERLRNDDFMDRVFPGLQIGMIVVDEVHCISNWGHDFRPDYKRIMNVVKKLEDHTPVLGTTATANDRVIEDIKFHLGELEVSRGPLIRDSLRIQIIKLATREEKLAWIMEHISLMDGSGIIYTATISTSEIVAKYLNLNGVSARAYHSQSEDRDILEQQFLHNEFKVMTATVALGMGFDKKDIAFVIHFHAPANIVSYYQQIGRAGRGLHNADIILLKGVEDDYIQESFIHKALPSEENMIEVLSIIKENVGITRNGIIGRCNIKQSIVLKCLQLLEIDEVIRKDKSKYVYLNKEMSYDQRFVDDLIRKRLDERMKLNQMIDTKDCYMKFIAKELDDPFAKKCGKCSNCIGDFYGRIVSNQEVKKAQQFLYKNYEMIPPRKMWPINVNNKGKIKHINKEGIVLCEYAFSKLGRIVKEDEEKMHDYSETIFLESVKALKKVMDNVDYVMCVPSHTNKSIGKFARNIALHFDKEYLDIIEINPYSKAQSNFYNSTTKCKNLENKYKIMIRGIGNVLLIDDYIHTRWTLTYIGFLLQEKGFLDIHPFTLSKKIIN